jgi:hypothetical protein
VVSGNVVHALTSASVELQAAKEKDLIIEDDERTHADESPFFEKLFVGENQARKRARGGAARNAVKSSGWCAVGLSSW